MTTRSLRRLLLLALPLAAANAADKPVLVPGATITLADSKGKFDFLEIDATRHRLLASHEKDDTADVFDLDTNKLLARVKVGPAVDVIVDPKTGNYFVSVQDDKRVAILDGKTFKEIGTVAVEGETDAIIFEPKSRRLYVTHDNGTHVWAVDVDAKKVVATITIPGAPECMALDAATGRIFLNIKTTNEVVVIDTAKNALVAKWSTAPAIAPHGIALDAAHGRLYAAGDNGVLAILDTKTGQSVGTVKITESVDQAAIDPELGLVYCAGTGFLSVVKITADGGKLLGRVATAETAKNVAVDLKNHSVWTTYTDGKNSFAQQWKQP